jgi:cytidine deaminase
MNAEDKVFQRLKASAVRAAGHSYSPYSQFRVGAAVLGASGQIHSGCNVENASFGLTQCAERAALTAAVADGAAPGTLGPLLLYTPGDTAHAPCGACRQVMNELMAVGAQVISCCDGDALRRWGAGDYLPDPFDAGSLPMVAAGERKTSS